MQFKVKLLAMNRYGQNIWEMELFTKNSTSASACEWLTKENTLGLNGALIRYNFHNCNTNIKKKMKFFFSSNKKTGSFLIVKYLYCVVFSKLQRNYIGNKKWKKLLFCPQEYRRRWINRHFGFKKQQCTT